MKKNKVKNIIRESIYNLLNEYSSEQRLPFNDDKFKNKNYLEQYADWLEDFGKYGKLPPSKANFWDEIKKGLDYIYDNDMQYNFRINTKNNKEFVSNYLIKNFFKPNIQITQDGKIYVEREVDIKNLPIKYDETNDKGKDPMNFYHKLVNDYQDNVGGCWCYKEGNAKAYCGGLEPIPLLLRGYIRADDIDYVKTLILNGKYFDEFEIRVKPNAKIEIFEAIWNKKYHLPLRGHLIVNATYFGNGGKYYGEYAPVDDGFGNNTAVDRKGKITDIEMALRGELSKNIPFSKIFDNMIYLDNRRFFGHFCNKYFLVSEDGYIVEGNNLFFDEVDEFGDYDISRVKRNDKGYSFIDRNGELINNGNMWFEMARQVHDNCAVIYVAGKGYSFINSQGVLCNKWFQDFEDFSCGFACVKRDDFKWSFIDLHGNLLKN